MSEVLVSVSPGYPSANLPSVALFPASLLVFGAIERTPLPVVVSPVVAVEEEAASAGSMVPQTSKARAAFQVVPTAGWTTVGDWLYWYLANTIDATPMMTMTIERGVPVHGHLPAIGGSTTRGSGACDRLA